MLQFDTYCKLQMSGRLLQGMYKVLARNIADRVLEDKCILRGKHVLLELHLLQGNSILLGNHLNMHLLPSLLLNRKYRKGNLSAEQGRGNSVRQDKVYIRKYHRQSMCLLGSCLQ